MTGSWRGAWLLCMWVLCAAVNAADAVPRSPEAITDFRVNNTAQMQQRSALLQSAELLLDQGDTAAAIDTLDRAAMMLHAPDTEMALVRAYLQMGDYRRALAFCAHTAGSHRETVAPSALYAWLLHAGGQPAYAERVLAEARLRLPDDPVLLATEAALAGAAPRAEGVMLAAPQRMAPHASRRSDDAPPAAATVVASGVLIDAGRHALVPANAIGDEIGNAIGDPTAVWLRNGLGETVAATVERRIESLGLLRLSLARPLDPGTALAIAPRDPFAGSPGVAVEYVSSPDAAPAWPWLHAGFFGAAAGSDLRRLGITMPRGPRGGPVFDAAGRLAGVALNDEEDPASGRDRFVPVSALRSELGDEPGPTLPATTRMPNDEVYERALRLALQVIVVKRSGL